MPRKKEVQSEKAVKSPIITSKTTRSKKSISTTATSMLTESGSRTTISREEREKMIAQTAYYRAEQRGFCGGNPVEDWLWAETEINKQLKAC